jgi:hypothetical protein
VWVTYAVSADGDYSGHRHKLMAHSDKPGKALFDLLTDPHETTNLVHDPEYAPIRGHLVELLDDMASSAVSTVGSSGERVR